MTVDKYLSRSTQNHSTTGTPPLCCPNLKTAFCGETPCGFLRERGVTLGKIQKERERERERGVWLNSGRASLNGVVMEKRICSLFDLRVVSFHFLARHGQLTWPNPKRVIIKIHKFHNISLVFCRLAAILIIHTSTSRHQVMVLILQAKTFCLSLYVSLHKKYCNLFRIFLTFWPNALFFNIF